MGENMTLPAILHNAFRAPDGSEAVVVANGTSTKQAGKLAWKGKTTVLELAPQEVQLIR